MKQVTAKGAALDALRQILAGDGEEAHVGDALGAAERGVAVLGEEAQQLGLRRQRQVLDAIEEQRAALGAFDPAGAGAGRAGERSGTMTEELALEQAAGKGSGVELDERTRGPRAQRMQPAGERRATAAGLAEQQHGRAARRRALEARQERQETRIRPPGSAAEERAGSLR